MKRTILAFLFVLGAGTAAPAATNMPASFYKPPEFYAPVWQTTFPYQRDINMGFGMNPVAAPGAGIPGALYAGTLDPSLKGSDYAQFSTGVQWYSYVTNTPGNGVVGLFNNSGSAWRNGTATFRLDNTTVANQEKHLWLEFDWYADPGTNFVMASVTGLTGDEWPTLGNPIYTDLPNGYVRQDIEFVTSPNPAWENVVFTFYVSPYSTVLLDNVHIATECVPEPALLALLGLGCGTLMIPRGWKRQ